MARRDGKAFQAIAREHFQKDFAIKLVREFTVRLDDGQTHRFDLGSEQGDILIDCKSYTFTKTGNEPAAKLNHAKTDALLLRASHAQRKLLVFDDDVHPKKGSLAALFERRNRVWLADVEVWRHWQGRFERVSPFAER